MGGGDGCWFCDGDLHVDGRITRRHMDRLFSVCDGDGRCRSGGLGGLWSA